MAGEVRAAFVAQVVRVTAAAGAMARVARG